MRSIMKCSYNVNFLLAFLTITVSSLRYCSQPNTCVSYKECSRRHKARLIVYACLKERTVCCPPVPPPRTLHKEKFSNMVFSKENSSAIVSMENQPNAIYSLENLSSAVYSKKNLTKTVYSVGDPILDHKHFHLMPNTCGYKLSNKVAFGDRAVVGQFPWMALFFVNNNGKRTQCGGTLISKSPAYVLTAAHCLDGVLKTVRLGELVINNKTKDCEADKVTCQQSMDLPVEEVKIHKEWDTDTFRNDIALIRLRSFNLNKYGTDLVPICLPWNRTKLEETANLLEIAGWGRANYAKGPSDSLQYASVCHYPLEDCKQEINLNRNAPTDTHICALGKAGEDVCAGDSGGPLMTEVLEEDATVKTYQLGITSWQAVEDCFENNYGKPSVYTRVDKYLGWILDNIRP